MICYGYLILISILRDMYVVSKSVVFEKDFQSENLSKESEVVQARGGLECEEHL